MNDQKAEDRFARPPSGFERAVPRDILRILQSTRRPLIAGHVTPDADCLGSAMGLATVMRENGIDASVALPSECVATRLQFMIELAPEIPRVPVVETADGYDALIMVDTAGE